MTERRTLTDADIDTDGTLAANSDTKVPSQKAVKTYADTKLASGATAGGDLTGTYPNPTVGAAKITTAKLASAVTLDAIAGANATAGDVSLNTHKLTNVTDPSSAQDAATKNYVDTAVNGLYWKKSSRLATAAALPTNVYANGASGVGATLTGTAFGALTVDGVTVVSGDRILVKNEVAGANNGIYVVTTVGAVATLYVLTRATDYNQTSEIQAGDATYVTEGSANTDTSWVMTTTGAITVGTTALVFTQFGGNLVTSVFSRTGAVVAVTGDYAGVVASALTGATAATRYVGGVASVAPTTGTFAVGDFVIAQNGDIFVCTVAGTPGTWTDLIAPGTHAATGKTTPVDADELPLVDSAASNVLKKLTWANLKATLDSRYALASLAWYPNEFISSKVGTFTDAASLGNGYSYGTLYYNSSNTQNDAIVWHFPITLPAGTYTLYQTVQKNNVNAIQTWEWSTDGSSWNSLTTYDAYNASILQGVGVTTASLVVSSAFSWLRMRAATRNASASGWTMVNSTIRLIRTA